MVVIPGGGDQWELANRVVRQGSARLIRPVSAEALVTEVTEVLAAPSYRQAARRAGESIIGVADPVRVCHESLAG
jgi:UDP:flavonoid glycosyltransferase YjiC (YdhE family)